MHVLTADRVVAIHFLRLCVAGIYGLKLSVGPASGPQPYIEPILILKLLAVADLVDVVQELALGVVPRSHLQTLSWNTHTQDPDC